MDGGIMDGGGGLDFPLTGFKALAIQARKMVGL